MTSGSDTFTVMDEQRPHSNSQKIAGYCPMGCGQTLFVGEGGAITCSLLSCPRPDAVHQLLSDRETEHIVVYGEETFSLKHPLRERIEGELFECAIHAHLASQPRPAMTPGTYRCRDEDGLLVHERLEE